MKYYLIPFVLASKLGVTGFRHGNSNVGYVVTAGDLVPLGIEVAKAAGAVAMSEAEAINVINKLKNI